MTNFDTPCCVMWIFKQITYIIILHYTRSSEFPQLRDRGFLFTFIALFDIVEISSLVSYS